MLFVQSRSRTRAPKGAGVACERVRGTKQRAGEGAAVEILRAKARGQNFGHRKRGCKATSSPSFSANNKSRFAFCQKHVQQKMAVFKDGHYNLIDIDALFEKADIYKTHKQRYQGVTRNGNVYHRLYRLNVRNITGYKKIHKIFIKGCDAK